MNAATRISTDAKTHTRKALPLKIKPAPAAYDLLALIAKQKPDILKPNPSTEEKPGMKNSLPLTRLLLLACACICSPLLSARAATIATDQADYAPYTYA